MYAPVSRAPISPAVKVRAYNHLLGETGLSFLGVPALARKFRPGFPGSLQDAPMLLPTPGTAVRRSLDQWFDAVDVRPRVVGEFDDSELRWEFGGTGIGVFSAPLVLETHLGRLYNVQRIGLTTALSTFYAISVERKLKHPAAVAICEAARHTLRDKLADLATAVPGQAPNMNDATVTMGTVNDILSQDQGNDRASLASNANSNEQSSWPF